MQNVGRCLHPGVFCLSPELELNDIGFLAQTDNISQWFWMQYRILKPSGITRWQRYNINEWREYDFGMKKIKEAYNVNAHWEFKNFWQSGGGISYEVQRSSNADLRGGPALRYPGSVYYWVYTSTDRRKKFSGMINHEFTIGRESYVRNANISFDLVFQPVNAFNISASPSFTWNKNDLQYVATASYNGGLRYVVAAIDQTLFRVTMRMTYMVTPNLSIQYYGQPFGSAGAYSDYKYITDASAASYADRFSQIPQNNVAWDGTAYRVDDNSMVHRIMALGDPISTSASSDRIWFCAGNTFRDQRSFLCGRESGTGRSMIIAERTSINSIFRKRGIISF